ncbi:unnamed protein product, partial [Iphiclides podalirius]
MAGLKPNKGVMLSDLLITRLNLRAVRCGNAMTRRNRSANRASRCAGLVAVVILASLPYSSALSLPSGDPAPGRSPGPPARDPQGDLQNARRKYAELNAELDAAIDAEGYGETTTDYYETTTAGYAGGDKIVDACAYARIPSDIGDIVTLSESDSDVNLTVGHAVFDAGELVRAVVYDAHAPNLLAIGDLNSSKHVDVERQQIDRRRSGTEGIANEQSGLRQRSTSKTAR